MSCAACNKPLPTSGSIEENGVAFCDNLCRYSFKKRGGSPSSESRELNESRPSATAEKQTTAAPSDHVLTHVLMACGMVYLLVTRYLVYVSFAELANPSFAKVLGANTAYFLIWGLAYWLSYTSPKSVPNAILGLVAVLAGPLLIPLVSFALLIGMWFIRRSQLTA